MNKRSVLLVFVLMMFLVVPMVSAVKIDYSPNDNGVKNMKAHVEDTIIFGLINIGEQGTMELKSHKSPTEVLSVGSGNQVTMIYDTNFGKAQQGALGDVTFIDMRTGKEVERDYKFVYWGNKSLQKEVCVSYGTLTNSSYGCLESSIENYQEEGWIDYNSKDLPQGKIRLGLMVDVQIGDYIDGIWEVQGKKIDKHASWIYELFSPVTLTSGTSNPPYVVDESRYLSSTYYAAWRAFSQLGDTMNFGSGSCVGDWARLDLGSGNTEIPALVSVTNHQSDSTRIPTGFKAQGSNDGSSWTDLASFSVSATTGQQNNRTISTSTAYRYFRILVTTSSSGGQCGFDKIYFYKQTFLGSNITLLIPENNYFSSNKEVLFSANISDNAPVNVSLYIDGVLNETNSSGITAVYNFTKILEDGSHNWTIEACIDTSCTEESRNLTIDTTPFIEFIPPTLPNYANITDETIPMYVNVSTDYFFNISYDLYNINGTSFNQYYETETFDYNFTNIPDAYYHYNVTICTTTGKCNSTETRHVNHDVTPPEILIDSPTGQSTYLYVGEILDLNFTATDELANVSECWYNYNGTNNSVACSNGTLVSVPIAQEYGLTSAEVYSNDTFGNEGFNSTSWSYKILELNKTFENETTEGSYEQFYLYLNEGSGVNVQSVVLHYDGQTDSASLFSSGDNLTAMSELLIGAVSADTNNTFYFTITLTDSTTFNTTNATQLVRDISIDDCSSNPYPLLYLYLKDEEAKTLLDGNIQTNIEVLNNFNYGQVLNISQEETNVSYVDLCSNVLLNETEFVLNAEIRYSSDNHSAEFYHIQRADLSSYPANISLFDLKTEDTTRFKVLYRNQDLIGIEGAVLQLQRKYIDEGIFEVVEAPLTSSDSTGILHIDTNTNKYQITVVKNGEVLGLFQNLAFICESELTGECTLNLYDKLVPPNIVPLVDLQDFSSGLESSIDNQTITLTYVVPSGTATSVQVLATQKDTILGESTICNQTIISSAGSIECSYSTTIQDSTIDYKVFKSGELVAQKGFVVQEDLRDDWGAANYILIVVFLLSLVFMALSSPEWIVINAVITVLISGGIWLIRGIGFVEGLGSLMWLIIGAIILISKLSKQEDF